MEATDRPLGVAKRKNRAAFYRELSRFLEEQLMPADSAAGADGAYGPESRKPLELEFICLRETKQASLAGGLSEAFVLCLPSP